MQRPPQRAARDQSGEREAEADKRRVGPGAGSHQPGAEPGPGAAGPPAGAVHTAPRGEGDVSCPGANLNNARVFSYSLIILHLSYFTFTGQDAITSCCWEQIGGETSHASNAVIFKRGDDKGFCSCVVLTDF